MARRKKPTRAEIDAEIAEHDAAKEKAYAERAKRAHTFSAMQMPDATRPQKPMGTTSTDLVFDANILEFKEQNKDKLTLSMNLGEDKPFSQALQDELFSILGENFTEMALKKIEKLQMLKLLTDAIIQ
jgi:hypothetical protein